MQSSPKYVGCNASQNSLSKKSVSWNMRIGESGDLENKGRG